MVSAVVSVLATVIAFVMGLNLLGTFFKPFQFYGRFVLCILSMCICASYGTFASIILALVGKKNLSQYVAGRSFSNVTCPLLGVNIKIKNEEILTRTRPVIFISNHQSEMDILMLGRIFPKYCSVTAKSSLKYVPFLGWFMMLSGTVFIDRQNRGKAIRALDGAVKKMRNEKQSVYIFPEGTRSYYTEPGMLPFKRGAFHLALQSGCPIVPVVIANYSHVFCLSKRVLQPGTIEVEVLDPIDTTNVSADDIDELISTTRAKMLEVQKRISPQVVKPIDEVTEDSHLLNDAVDTTDNDLVPRTTSASDASAALSANSNDDHDESETDDDTSKFIELNTRE
ncbi:hypothetical protein V1511DRAFT_455020 [Dipodascopsis uninucleata]